MKTLFNKIVALLVLIPTVGLSTAGILLPTVANAETTECSTITLVSNANTQTAGYTESNPGGAALSLQATLYSAGSFVMATGTEQSSSPVWINPSVDSNFSGSGAIWISTSPLWPGNASSTEGSASNNQWRLFEKTFVLPANATVTSATIHFAADNAAAVYLNGNTSPIATTNATTTEAVYGDEPSVPNNAGVVFSSSFNPMPGVNTLDFVVRNWTGSSQNPTGLLYKAVVDYCVTIPDPTFQVTIAKYIQGSAATGVSASSTPFLMSATWNASNIGSGTGQYSLEASSSVPYQTMTAQLASGGSYSTHEIMSDGSNATTTCSSGQRYVLDGYTTGNTLAEAALGTPSMTVPNFTNLTGNKAVIVWNRDCTLPAPVTAKVHILKYVDGVIANASSSNSFLFPITVNTQQANLNGGATTTSTVFLGNNSGGSIEAYGAVTAAVQTPFHFSASELTSTTTNFLPQGQACVEGKYRLEGYKTSSISFAHAASSTMQVNSPVWNAVSGDQYIIVYNTKCTASNSGDSPLAVTGIASVKNSGTADNTFESGWKYLFNVTVPFSEINLSMKFSDWVGAAASSTIPVAGNIRISSAQANNSGSPVLLSAANTYSSPVLLLNSDADPMLPGRQVQVLAEVKIPFGTVNTSYTTTYGIQTLP